MRCPFCSSSITRVVDKRAVVGSGEIRRRRECLKCIKRFTTYERLGRLEIFVIKKDGHRESFNLEKLKIGIIKALEKRPGLKEAEVIAEKIEKNFRCKGVLEVPSKTIGKAVLQELKKIDTVAYLRFASVYRRFENPEDFTKEVSSLGN